MSYTLRGSYRNIEAGFSCAYIWRHKHNHEIATTDNGMYIRFTCDDKEYITPYGVKDWALAIEEIEKLHPGASFGDMTRQDALEIERAAPGRYTFTESRDGADYLYLRESLAKLEGKKYHGKRNFCSRFEREYAGEWQFEPIVEQNIDDVWRFHDAWVRKNDGSGSLTLQEESTTIALLIYNMSTLGAQGGLLRVGGNVVAFTAGAPVSRDTYDIIVEKADYEIAGAYPMISREFVRSLGDNYTYINREDDMGLENLRKAKLSYHPCEIICKYFAEPVKNG